MTFAGTNGQRVSLTASLVTIPNSTVWIERPNGATLTQFTTGTSGHFMSPVTLPQNGTYIVHIDPQGSGTGHMSLDPEVVPGDPVYPILANGVLVERLERRGGPERALHVHRLGEPEDQPRRLELDHGLGQRLDPEAGRLDARLELLDRLGRRLRRHDDAAR